MPFTDKAKIELKKVGLELVVRVAEHKRNIMLPPALAPYRPQGAKFDDGALTVTFERPAPAEDRVMRQRPEAALSEVRGDRRRRRGRPLDFECVDFCPICRTADVLRATMPEEFQEHWHALQKEMLLAMRSLLDHYIHHVETQRPSAAPVEDIPIE